MLFTLVYAYLSFVLKWKNRRRRMKFFRLMRSLCRHSSISAIQGSAYADSAGGSVFQRVPNNEALELVTESEGRVEVGPKTVLDLKGWTLYMGVSPEEVKADGNQYILFEAVSRPDPTPPGCSLMKVTDYGTPLAWKSGPPFNFLMRCNLDNLVTLVMGMIDRRLTAEDNLDIQSLTTVQVKGHADRLIQTHSPASVWKSNAGGEMPEANSVGSSNESLASVGRESLDLQQLSALSESADIDMCDEEIQNVLDSESDDGDYAAGEAMAEFSEDANLEVEGATSNGFQRNVDTDHSKPPNILIYCGKKDSSRKFEGVRQIFAQCLHPERYVIYHLKHDQVHTTPWKENSALLILSSEKLYDGVDEAVYKYFRNGGKVLSFCSSLDNFIIKRDPYQDSPMNVLLLNCGKRINVTVIGGRFAYGHIKDGLMRPNDISSIDVLGVASEFGDKPVIIKAKAEQKDSEKSGVAILSQVYLDKDPGEMGISTKIFTLLKESNPAKFEIISDLLEQLGMDCTRVSLPRLTPGILLAKQKTSISHVLESLSARMKDRIIRTPKKTLQFVEEGGEGGQWPVTEDTLPVYSSLSNCPHKAKYFNADRFFTHLKTESLGQVILYTDVVPTTMTLIDGMMFSLPSDVGLVAIAGRQTSGRGRGGNAWISPVGCAMFTAHVRFTVESLLGQRAAYLQHITAVAVVHSIRQLKPYQDVDLRVKWPNDIYFGQSMKLGGVIVTSSVTNGVMHALVGCGFNVSNSNPTICISDIIQQHNQENGTNLQPLSTEELLGRVITTMETLINEFQKNGCEPFCDLYYKYWLHSGSRVRVEAEDEQEVTIQGLDEHGYLKVMTSSGEPLSLQPDGNTFDMLRNLISIKAR
ncbi:biotin--protein ligase-like [Liolophura sinensis]|uniref:biotin--protein ligase-like n=1 Tax=Liolophura sinensis TaxID=3198878 RepID=UPI003159768E